MNAAWRFVAAIGLVSLLADLTYEGGRSISGAFLGSLGATAALVGFVAGFGEFLGYLVRLASGRLADRFRLHWPLLYVGYAANLLAVPALALAQGVQGAGLLLFLERFGKGLRTPARDALLARAGEQVGHGKAFGVHETLDQLGAFLGPLLVALGVALGGYRLGFALLLIPALLALLVLSQARGLEPKAAPQPKDGRLPPGFPLYLLYGALFALGLVHFQILGFHLERSGAPGAQIPLFYALAMGADALFALFGGLLFDRLGLKTLLLAPLLALGGSPLLLSGTPGLWWAGSLLWGGALGLQESVMRAGVGRLSGGSAFAYGVFDTAFGLAWLLGSVAMGLLYDRSPGWVVAFAVVAEALALLPLALLLYRERR
ncbi:MFS transporter [Thermus thermamylovorans]|uniref:MFS transporter n=1 Tax=Thermus thermamylovorans TaxID=2509362 RepID=A0A4Q9B148_9DEIN|nr:MFS transporter [Thermus thermamylovorans]TBH16537.1 MFS transporter [Thermus thermamylovorans]